MLSHDRLWLLNLASFFIGMLLLRVYYPLQRLTARDPVLPGQIHLPLQPQAVKVQTPCVSFSHTARRVLT